MPCTGGRGGGGLAGKKVVAWWYTCRNETWRLFFFRICNAVILLSEAAFPPQLQWVRHLRLFLDGELCY